MTNGAAHKRSSSYQKVALSLAFVMLCSVLWGCQGDKLVNDPEKESSAETVVAIIDSEFDARTVNHLRKRLWTDSDGVAGWDFVDSDSDVTRSEPSDSTIAEHGDLTLGSFLVSCDDTAAVKLMLLRGLESSDEASSLAPVLDAVNYAESHGANICLLSLSCYKDEPELKKCLEESEMLFVVAAGNEGVNLDEGFSSYPTSYRLPNIISVAALNARNELLESSNFGHLSVDIATYGIVDLGDGRGGEGTSVAAPRVAAVAALARTASRKALTANELKEMVVGKAVSSDSSAKFVMYGCL